MGLPIADRLASPAGRTSLFYFTLFLVPAMANPYLPIWLSEQGISKEQIGTINAAPIFVMIVLNIIVGRIADRASDWRQVIIFGAIFGCLAPAGLFFVEGFWPILLVWSLIVLPFQAISPVVDAATLRMCRRIGVEFGKVRLWGTLGFTAATIPAGFLFGWFGAAIFVPMILVASLIRAATSLQLPLFRSAQGAQPKLIDPHAEIEPINPLIATKLKELWRPWFLLPLIGAALVHGSHMLQMSFGALLWSEQGVSPAVIGLLWAVAPASEVVIMLYFTPLAKRFSARHLILASCVFALVRWVGFSMEPPIWGYALLQILHLGSFALGYMGIVNFIANWTSEDIAAQAQSVFVMIRQIVTVIALSSFGFIVASIGTNAFLVAGGIAVAGGVLIFISLMLMSPKRELSETSGST